MININLNAKTVSDALEKLASPELADKISDVAAEVYYSEVMDFIASGRSFTPRTGNLQRSIGFTIDEQVVSRLFAGASYAPYVEFGTKIARPYPFFYTDIDNRAKHIQQAAMETAADFIQEI